MSSAIVAFPSPPMQSVTRTIDVEPLVTALLQQRQAGLTWHQEADALRAFAEAVLDLAFTAPVVESLRRAAAEGALLARPEVQALAQTLFDTENTLQGQPLDSLAHHRENRRADVEGRALMALRASDRSWRMDAIAYATEQRLVNKYGDASKATLREKMIASIETAVAVRSALQFLSGQVGPQAVRA